MALAVMIVGAAFGALCVWLTVRVFNRRERWAMLALSVVAGMALGFGILAVLSARLAPGNQPFDIDFTDGASRFARP
jgi:hypothetical protein